MSRHVNFNRFGLHNGGVVHMKNNVHVTHTNTHTHSHTFLFIFLNKRQIKNVHYLCIMRWTAVYKALEQKHRGLPPGCPHTGMTPPNPPNHPYPRENSYHSIWKKMKKWNQHCNVCIEKWIVFSCSHCKEYTVISVHLELCKYGIQIENILKSKTRASNWLGTPLSMSICQSCQTAWRSQQCQEGDGKYYTQ